MENFIQALQQPFAITELGAFRAHAAYYEDLDCIEYVKKDAVIRSERIDQLLTLIYDRSNNVVGFKLKGFRNFFENHLRTYYEFTNQDFIDLMSAMEVICSLQAEKMLKQSGDTSKIKNAYNIVRKMTREEALKLYDFPMYQVAA